MSEPNMDRFHEGRSLRGRDDEAAHLREIEAEDRECEKELTAEDLERSNQRKRELLREEESLEWVFKKKEGSL